MKSSRNTKKGSIWDYRGFIDKREMGKKGSYLHPEISSKITRITEKTPSHWFLKKNG